MIKFKTISLKNGLTVISDYIPETPIATFSIAYKVGSKNEDENKTGLAHLFEHLMFGGSRNVASFDNIVDMASGTNNAFTTSDYTNYYITLPAANIETAFYLESDRMFSPNLSEETLETQRKVVIEEFKQRVFNPPYGDLMSNLLPLAYKKHPYRWPVIGAHIEHIEKFSLSDVKDFHSKYYTPSNAVVSVSGNVKPEIVFELANKWFGLSTEIKSIVRKQIDEPQQNELRKKIVEKDVPMDMIVLAYHMGKRDSRDFYNGDLLSDVLSYDRSSRFQQYLKKSDAIFTSLSASITGFIENGLFLVKGKLNDGISIEQGMEVIERELQKVQVDLAEEEVQKVINKLITFQKVGHLDHANRAMDLCYADIVRSPQYINDQFTEYQKTTKLEIQQYASELLRPENCNLLVYKKKK
jgi:zinc protease